jgi:adenylosuccinate lyase
MNVTSALVVYEKMIRTRLMAELPFMATENILMDAVKKGGDRQELHEKIRVHSQAAARRVKEDGEANDLLARIAADPAFGYTMEELTALLDPALYMGRSAAQVDAFVETVVDPLLERYLGEISGEVELNV